MAKRESYQVFRANLERWRKVRIQDLQDEAWNGGVRMGWERGFSDGRAHEVGGNATVYGPNDLYRRNLRR